MTSLEGSEKSSSSPSLANILQTMATAAAHGDHYRVIEEGRMLRSRSDFLAMSPAERADVACHLGASYHALRMNNLAMAEADIAMAATGLSAAGRRRVRRLYARVAPLAGNADKAITVLEGLLQEQPQSLPVRLQLAHLIKNRDPARSLMLLQEASALSAGTEAAIPLAEQLRALGRSREAIAVAESALSAEPQRHLLLLAAGNAHLHQGDRKKWASYFSDFITASGGGTPIAIGDPLSAMALACLPLLPADRSLSGSHRVVVVITTYNAAETVEIAVRSVLAQNCGDFKLVIVDDASTDDTLRILHALAADDRRITVVASPQNIGTFHCRNLAIAAQDAEFYAFHDADDWMHPDRIARHLTWMDQHPEAIISNSKWFRMTPDGSAVAMGGVQYVMNNPASAFVRREAFARAGLFEPGHWGGDSEFIWRIRRCFGAAAVQNIDLVLAVGLARPDSLTRSYVPTDEDGRSDIRTAYNEAWLEWHLSQPEGGNLVMPPEPEHRPFRLPRQIDDAANTGKRAVVATIATGDYGRIWDFAIKSQQRYAAKNGFEHRLHRSCFGELNVKWSKMAYGRQILSEGSHLLLIDADVGISNNCPDFMQLLAQHPDKDIFYALGNSGRANSGVLILRGGSGMAAEFLDYCVRGRTTPVPAESFVTEDGENGHVIDALRQACFQEASVEIGRPWNCMHPDGVRYAYLWHYTNQLGKMVRGDAAVRTMEPQIFLCPVSQKSIYARLLLGSLSDRFKSVFVEEGGLTQAAVRLEIGIPALVHLHWEEFFFNGLNEDDAAGAWAVVETVKRDLARYRAAGGRMLWTVHNTVPHQSMHRGPFLALRAHLAEVADVVLVHSAAAIEVVRQQVATLAGRVEVLPHPSYIGHYEPAGAAEAALDLKGSPEPLILGFGRLEERKGFEGMIKALPAELVAEWGARILIAGHGTYGRVLKQRFATRTDIDWDLRFIPEGEVGPLFRRAACVVLPYERFLTSGIAMLALTLGAVIVAPAAPQLVELLPLSAQRFLYRPGDLLDLRRAICEALALSPAESREIREAGLAVAAKLAPETVAARLRAIYEQELSETIPRAPTWQSGLDGLHLLDTPPQSGLPIFGTWPSTDLLAENWGDKLNPVLMSLLSGQPALHVREAPKSSMAVIHRVIGSGLADAKPRETVWGSGFIASNARIPEVRAIHAVRGPLSRDRLVEAGVDCPDVLGDAALLMPLFYRPDIQPSWDLGIIQHFREAGVEPLPVVPEGMRVKIISILGSITGVIDDILSCKQIVSSSLHGLIVAHAYGVPATWIKFGDRALGDGFKFRDYWASVGWRHAEPIWVNGETSCADLVGTLRTIRPLVDVPALIEACPFVDPMRKKALLRRASEVFPCMPDVSFLPRAKPAAVTPALSKDTAARQDERPLISVIIAVRNWGLDRLKLSLRSIREGEAGDRMEIVLCDFGSDDRSAVAAIGDHFGCRNIYVEAPQWSRSQAINAAVSCATAPFIVTGDADILFTPRALVTMREQLDAVPHAVHAVSYFDLTQDFPVEALQGHATLPWSELRSGAFARPRWGMGCAACSIEVFETVRGYDERMVVWGAEDRDFVARCQRNGFPVHWIEEPEVGLYHIWHKPFLTGGKSHVDVHVHNKRLMADKNLERNFLPGVKLRAHAPLISVVIATYNRAALLRQSIDSVLNQSLQDFEIVVVDDGSTDDTETVVAGFSDARIRYKRRASRGGVPVARNDGNRMARGKYIAIHDDDDLMFPDRLERQIATIQPGDVGSYGGWIDFTPVEEGGDLCCNPGRGPFALGPLMFSSKLQLHPALLIRREVCLQHPYEESFSGGSDYHLVSRLAVAGYRLAHCGSYIIMRRLHATNMTRQASDRQRIASRMTRTAVLGFLPPDMEKSLRAEGQASVAQMIQQARLPEQVAGMIGEDYLCSTDRLPFDAALFKALGDLRLIQGIRLRRIGKKIVPETILLDRRQRSAYAELIAGYAISPGTPRLRKTMTRRSYNSRMTDRYLHDNRLQTSNLPLTSPELEFFQEADGRVVGMRFAAQDWPGVQKLNFPVDADEDVLLLLNGSGDWTLLFRLESDLEFSLRSIVTMGHYPSLSLYEMVEDSLV